MPLVFFGLPQSMSGVLKKLDMSLRERYKYFLLLIGETTHEAQGKQPASPLKTIDAFTMEKDSIVVWAIKHPMNLRKT